MPWSLYCLRVRKLAARGILKLVNNIFFFYSITQLNPSQTTQRKCRFAVLGLCLVSNSDYAQVTYNYFSITNNPDNKVIGCYSTHKYEFILLSVVYCISF